MKRPRRRLSFGCADPVRDQTVRVGHEQLYKQVRRGYLSCFGNGCRGAHISRYPDRYYYHRNKPRSATCREDHSYTALNSFVRVGPSVRGLLRRPQPGVKITLEPTCSGLLSTFTEERFIDKTPSSANRTPFSFRSIFEILA